MLIECHGRKSTSHRKTAKGTNRQTGRYVQIVRKNRHNRRGQLDPVPRQGNAREKEGRGGVSD